MLGCVDFSSHAMASNPSIVTYAFLVLLLLCVYLINLHLPDQGLGQKIITLFFQYQWSVPVNRIEWKNSIHYLKMKMKICYDFYLSRAHDSNLLWFHTHVLIHIDKCLGSNPIITLCLSILVLIYVFSNSRCGKTQRKWIEFFKN